MKGIHVAIFIKEEVMNSKGRDMRGVKRERQIDGNDVKAVFMYKIPRKEINLYNRHMALHQTSQPKKQGRRATWRMKTKSANYTLKKMLISVIFKKFNSKLIIIGFKRTDTFSE